MENYKITVHDISIDENNIENSKILDTSHTIETAIPTYLITKLTEMFNTFDKDLWSVTELINPEDLSVEYSIIPYSKDIQNSITEIPTFQLSIKKTK